MNMIQFFEIELVDPSLSLSDEEVVTELQVLVKKL